MSRPTGAVLYRGPSRLDPTVPIVAVLTYRSTNAKTGDIPQVWILREDVAPHVAIREGSDVAICGDCPLRSVASGGTGDCYVVAFQGPRSVWQAFRDGRYPAMGPAALRATLSGSAAVRIGAYGDPYAVPVAVWERLRALMPERARMLGYTHQWRQDDAPDYAPLMMASVHGMAETREAQAQGWRTFRARRASDAQAPGSITCPASRERGFIATCGTCRACDGTARGTRASVEILMH